MAIFGSLEDPPARPNLATCGGIAAVSGHGLVDRSYLIRLAPMATKDRPLPATYPVRALALLVGSIIPETSGSWVGMDHFPTEVDWQGGSMIFGNTCHKMQRERFPRSRFDCFGSKHVQFAARQSNFGMSEIEPGFKVFFEDECTVTPR